MKKKALKAALAFFIFWVFFVALEGLLLIGSTDPGKAPLIVLGGAHIADEIDAYSSLGFSQTYYLTYPDSFVSGEFKVFGVKVAGSYPISEVEPCLFHKFVIMKVGFLTGGLNAICKSLSLLLMTCPP